MKTITKLSTITCSIILCSSTHAIPEQNYQNSEKSLNTQYSLIQGYIKDTPTEKNNLLNQQRQWLKTRNNKCGFKENSTLNSTIQNCVVQENNQRLQYFKSEYFNFDSLEKSLIRPITYNKTGQKILANNECFCDANILQIKNNKLYVYSACDEKLAEPQIYNIVQKIKKNTSVEYAIDSNKDQVADFNLAFVIAGQNTWKIVSKVYGKQNLINLNFKVNYTTNPQVKRVQQDCGDFDG